MDALLRTAKPSIPVNAAEVLGLSSEVRAKPPSIPNLAAAIIVEFNAVNVVSSKISPLLELHRSDA